MRFILAALALVISLSSADAATAPTQPPPFVPIPLGQPAPEGLARPSIQPKAPVVMSRNCSGPGPVCVRAYRFDARVDSKSAAAVSKFLEDAARDHVDVVMLELTTLGGSYDAGHEIARRIENAPMPVVCVADGVVASMGVYIFEACDRRLITTRGMLMLHSALAGIEEGTTMLNEHDLQARLNVVRALNRAYGAHVTAKMHLTLDQYLAKIDGKEWWLNAPEALNVGAADDVYPSNPNQLVKDLATGKTP